MVNLKLLFVVSYRNFKFVKVEFVILEVDVVYVDKMNNNDDFSKLFILDFLYCVLKYVLFF